MIDGFLSLPWLLILMLIVGTFAVLGGAGFSLTRRLVLPRLGNISHLQNEVTGFFHHGVLIIYGLAVALLAIAVWEKHTEIKKIVASEAVAIAALYRDVAGYPEPVRTHLQSVLKTYTEQIIHEAWPLQRQGKVPTGGVVILNDIQAALFRFEPATEGQKARHGEALRAYNTFVLARRMRLDTVTSGLPAPMWVVVLFGGLITLFSSFFFEVGNPRLLRLQSVLLSMTLGLLIFLIAFYDRPFRGPHGISAEPYELIHEQLMTH